MLTNSWYKILAFTFAEQSNATLAIKRFYDGGTFTTFNANYDIKFRPVYSSILTSKTGAGIAFGSDDTPPTTEDYTITPIVNLTGSITTKVQFSEGQVIRTAVATLTNNGEESVTIKEVAAVSYVTNYATNNYLLDRTVLDEPVTIPAGGVGQVVYTITFNYPAATTETD